MNATEWMISMGAMLILPVLFIPLGIVMVKLGRGFNTFSRAAITREAQIFAARMMGGMMTRVGIISLVLILAGGGIGFAFIDSGTIQMTIFWIAVIVPLVLIVIPIILTELAVRRHFDKDGKPYK